MKVYKNLENFVGLIPNFSYFFSSNIISYFFSFIFIILFARNYSSFSFGQFTIAQTVFVLLYSISFSNIHYYLNKILSTKFENRRKDIGSCFIITFYTSVGLYIFLATFLLFLNIDKQLRDVMLVLNLILITAPFSIFYSEIFIRGQFARIFKMKFYQTLIFFNFKIYLVLNNFDIIYIASAYVLESLFFSIIVIFYFKKNGNNFSKLIFDKKYSFQLLKKIMFFPVMAFAIVVAMRLDILMISMFIGEDQSGIYSAASRLIIIILLFGTHLFQFIYPNLNRISFTNNRIKPIYNNLVLFSFYLGLSFLFFSIFFGDFYLSLFGNEYLYALSAFKILSFTIFPALVFNLWIHKQYILSKYSTIIFFQLGTILINILLNYYLINIMGISGAALASLVAPIMSFLIINIPNNHEFRTIVESFSLKKQKEAANAVLKIIFVKKNPDKFENIKD